MIRRATLVALPAVLVAGLLAVLLQGDDDAPGPAQGRIEVVAGAVRVTDAAGATRRVTDAETVDFGDVVEVVDGTARLELADGSTYELRHRDGVGSTATVGSPPELTAGDALVLDGFPAAVRVGTATLRAQGALRVDAASATAVAYGGRVGVAGVGDVAELPMLRRLVLVPGASPEPAAFDGADEWDRRFLGEAIAFGQRLEALARGYTNDLPPGGGRSVEFFAGVLPALEDEREFNADLLDPGRAPGETLVGAAIAVQGRRGTFRDRWSEVFAFRAAGAAWGLVALDQGVSSAPLLETIELAIGAPTRAGADTPPSTTTTTTPGTAATTTTSTSTTSTTAPPPGAPPAPDPPAGGLLGPVVDPVGDLLGGLLDQLLGGG
ncbi:MAG TPA: hypothetical protein VFV42_13045 [Acidimicrobiales bacterium]|nr:hypothetical protein [Acidimicrobiales bacterium]